MENLPIVILISGQGTNLQTIIDATTGEDPPLPVKILAVISNQADAFGIIRATRADIPTHILPHKNYPHRAAFEKALQAKIDEYAPKLVVLAGFMRKLGPNFVKHYHGRLINIHPSLLPKYPGLHTHQRVLAAGDQEHGATVHYVDDTVDAGPIICQGRFKVHPEDTADRLKQRVQPLEYLIYPQVLLWIASHRLELKDDHVFLDGQPLPKSGIQIDPSCKINDIMKKKMTNR